MAAERSTAEALPLPPRLSASSPATVTNAAGAGTIRRECSSPRSFLSRILGRGGGGGFGCRLRIPRYCSSGAGAAAKEDAGEEEVAAPAPAPKVVVASGQETEVRESPRSSLQLQGTKAAPEVSAASLGIGAGLVLLLSRGAAELSRMAELRAQMERLVLDVRAEARGSSRSDASDGHVDDGASVVKERIVFADAPAGGGEDTSLSRGSRDAASACGDVGDAVAAMDQMEAELEAELTRLQLDSDDGDGDGEEDCVTPRRDRQLEPEAKSGISSESGSSACVDIDGVLDDAARLEHEDNEEEEREEEDTDEEEEEDSKPCHGGVPARVLERRLHELLQSRHEERIAQLETELERAQRKLRDKEREVSRWRDTAKLVSRHKDDSRLR